MVVYARILWHPTTLSILCLLLVSSGIGNGDQPPLEQIQGDGKLDYEEDQMLFPFLPETTTQRDTNPGNVPIVNPTTPGTTPIVNPTGPSPPAPTGPTTKPTPPALPGGGVAPGGGTGGGSWCIANPTASPTALQVALDYACGYGGADCSAIQPNGACYDPNTVRDHASYAFNNYYQKNPAPTSCDFGGTAQLSYNDPSHGNCRYASPTSTPTMPPPTTTMTPTIPMTPPSTSMGNPYPTGGNGFGSEPTGYDYGAEPTATPNSVDNVSLNLLLLITMNCIIFSATLVNNN
ncbi:extensin-like [Andrographis paniculata]|uniref:extensin-like n=1 Tax=Andrographis paniculata TaxID=175694 RepID=UPI0021E8AF58|nr:extensin-like [Andrographis paniculata]